MICLSDVHHRSVTAPVPQFSYTPLPLVAFNRLCCLVFRSTARRYDASRRNVNRCSNPVTLSLLLVLKAGGYLQARPFHRTTRRTDYRITTVRVRALRPAQGHACPQAPGDALWRFRNASHSSVRENTPTDQSESPMARPLLDNGRCHFRGASRR